MVQRANVMLGRDGRSKGHGIVLFATVEDATKAQGMASLAYAHRLTCQRTLGKMVYTHLFTTFDITAR